MFQANDQRLDWRTFLHHVMQIGKWPGGKYFLAGGLFQGFSSQIYHSAFIHFQHISPRSCTWRSNQQDYPSVSDQWVSLSFRSISTRNFLHSYNIFCVSSSSDQGLIGRLFYNVRCQTARNVQQQYGRLSSSYGLATVPSSTILSAYDGGRSFFTRTIRKCLKTLFIPFHFLHSNLFLQAILLGLGLQHKTVDKLVEELGLPSSQLLGLFNRVMRRSVQYLNSVAENFIENTITVNSNSSAGVNLNPVGGKSMHEELEDAAKVRISFF